MAAAGSILDTKVNKMDNSIKVYVSTYAKYNNGNLNGAWVDLEEFNDKQAFLEFIQDLHKDESDPEFMYQDFEGFPKDFYSESDIDERIFEYCKLDDDEKDIVSAFLDCYGDCAGDVFEVAKDAYYGNFDSDEDFASEMIESSGDLNYIPEHLQYYFDYEKYARDLMMGDFSRSNNHYFSNNW